MEKPNLPEEPLQCHGSRVTTEGTAMSAHKATKVHDAALLISAFASLITALTGVAVLLLH
ncbi:hypothetical protein ACFZAG_14175 [Streptomyces sp. NPDC012403]|uniref:hypothetical protein n=1 Tax=Streptomyces sp. NPDC012403 TaxID=3364831 RepID=UPI0036ED9B41